MVRATAGLVAAGVAAVVAAVVAGVLLAAAGPAHGDEARDPGPAPLIGDVTVFNDEIVEPVSLPVSTCGGVLQVLSQAPSTCADTSRVSDDDA